VRKPVGWEESVQRMRLARIDRNEIQAALDPRSGPVKVSQEGQLARWRKAQEDAAERKVGGAEEVDTALGI
jgi:hypothetical protein